MLGGVDGKLKHVQVVALRLVRAYSRLRMPRGMWKDVKVANELALAPGNSVLCFE